AKVWSRGRVRQCAHPPPGPEKSDENAGIHGHPGEEIDAAFSRNYGQHGRYWGRLPPCGERSPEGWARAEEARGAHSHNYSRDFQEARPVHHPRKDARGANLPANETQGWRGRDRALEASSRPKGPH